MCQILGFDLLVVDDSLPQFAGSHIALGIPQGGNKGDAETLQKQRQLGVNQGVLSGSVGDHRDCSR